MRWRLVPFTVASAVRNMATDEALLESVANKKSGPIVRCYGWNPTAVSVGVFQSVDKEVNRQKCEEIGIDVVRRITGGGAVVHAKDNEVTYSIIVPQELAEKGITESYKVWCNRIVQALATLGIVAEFHPINDIITNKKKISGNAQTRRNGVVLQHGTILYEVDVPLMFSVLNVSPIKIQDKMIADVSERVTAIRRLVDVSYADVVSAMQTALLASNEFDTQALTSEEVKRVEELIIQRYKSKEWTNQR